MGNYAIRLAAIGVVGATLLLPGQTKAGTIPTAYAGLCFYTPSGQVDQCRLTAASDISGSYQGASAAVSVSSGPVLLAFSTAGDNAQAHLSYSFQVSGPSAVFSVPIDISYVVEAVGDIRYDASSATLQILQASLFDYPILRLASNDGSAVVTGTSSDASRTATFSTSVSSQPNITLGVFVNVVLDAFARGPNGSAFIDPTISIDPTFFAANPQYTPSDFTITQSAGVANGNTSNSVPEPSSVILLVGVVSLCALTRRKFPGVDRTCE